MKVEWDNVEAAQKYVSEPDWYNAKAVSVVTITRDDRDPQWEVTWEVQEGPAKGQTFRDWMTLNRGNLPRFKVLYSRVGLPTEGAGELRESDLRGKQCWVWFRRKERRIQDENGKWVGTGEFKLQVDFAGFRALEDGPGAGDVPAASAAPVADEKPDESDVPFSWLLAFILGGLLVL